MRRGVKDTDYNLNPVHFVSIAIFERQTDHNDDILTNLLLVECWDKTNKTESNHLASHHAVLIFMYIPSLLGDSWINPVDESDGRRLSDSLDAALFVVVLALVHRANN